jgi:hypothetical protein
MGVLICEILAITPIFLDEYGYEILKAVFVPMPSIETSTDGTRENGTKLKEEDILKGLKSKIAGRVFMAQPKVKRKSQQQELLSVQEVKIAEQIVKDHKMNIAEVGMLDDAEEEVLNDEEMEMLKQMLSEKKLKEEEEIGKKTKVEKARQNLLIHFPAIYKLLEVKISIRFTKKFVYSSTTGGMGDRRRGGRLITGERAD